MDFTEAQANRIDAALHTWAITQGADDQDLRESAVAFGGSRNAIRTHVDQVEREHGCRFGDLSGITQNVLEQYRSSVDAVVWTTADFAGLERRAWAVVLSAAGASA